MSLFNKLNNVGSMFRKTANDPNLFRKVSNTARKVDNSLARVGNFLVSSGNSLGIPVIPSLIQNGVNTIHDTRNNLEKARTAPLKSLR